MTHRIEPGQIYRSCQPVRSEPEPRHIRIKVVGKPMTIPGVWGFGSVNIVTLTADGREIRRRAIECTQLHATPTTRSGQPRRTGYALEQQ
ncbi:hypothetical protein E2C11_16430 [Streptomyces lavendulae]|nr:hypothetical protein [Streptomyces lavendulae]TXJ78593.1 hypothetical protein E2C11_16430 [Streptomyces lavendulae]